MRKIKFQVYDIKRKIMLNVDTIEFLNGGVRVSDGATFQGWVTINKGFENTLYITGKLREYTGLKDKNGTEIYEGDIVKYGYEDFEKNKTIHQIKWCGDENYPAFDLKPHLGIKSNGLFHAMNEGEIEIIGNIYENPEFLKVFIRDVEMREKSRVTDKKIQAILAKLPTSHH